MFIIVIMMHVSMLTLACSLRIVSMAAVLFAGPCVWSHDLTGSDLTGSDLTGSLTQSADSSSAWWCRSAAAQSRSISSCSFIHLLLHYLTWRVKGHRGVNTMTACPSSPPSGLLINLCLIDYLSEKMTKVINMNLIKLDYQDCLS